MTLKGFFLLARRADVSPEQFSHHWLHVHAPMAPDMPNLLRYAQSHRLDPPEGLRALAERCPYEGLAELWAESIEDFVAMRRSPAYVERLGPDEEHFVDRAASDWLGTTEHVVIDRGQPAPIKLMFLARRRPGLTVEEFQRHWLDVHAPLVDSTPGLVRYVQCHVTPDSYGARPPAWDGVAELCFADRAALGDALGSDSFRVQRADVERFIDIDTIAAFVAREHVLIGAAGAPPGAAEGGGPRGG